MVYLDEIEEFDSWGNIRVFRTGLGKQKFDMNGNARSDPRSLMTSTNGDKRGGPLDKYLNDADEILFNGVFDNGTLFFIYCLDEKEEVHDSKNWIKANPSIDYFKSLKDEIEKEYAEYKKDPVTNSSFMSLRMNLPVEKKEDPVTSWENIQATNQELPPLERTSERCLAFWVWTLQRPLIWQEHVLHLETLKRISITQLNMLGYVESLGIGTTLIKMP